MGGPDIFFPVSLPDIPDIAEDYFEGMVQPFALFRVGVFHQADNLIHLRISSDSLAVPADPSAL